MSPFVVPKATSFDHPIGTGKVQAWLRGPENWSCGVPHRGCPTGERKEAVARADFPRSDQFSNLPVTVGQFVALMNARLPIADGLPLFQQCNALFDDCPRH